jgi:hypothetical protein
MAGLFHCRCSLGFNGGQDCFERRGGDRPFLRLPYGKRVIRTGPVTARIEFALKPQKLRFEVMHEPQRIPILPIGAKRPIGRFKQRLKCRDAFKDLAGALHREPPRGPVCSRKRTPIARPFFNRASFLNAEADPPFLFLRRRHKLANGVENHFELRVVLLLERLQFSGQFRVRCQH